MASPYRNKRNRDGVITGEIEKTPWLAREHDYCRIIPVTEGTGKEGRRLVYDQIPNFTRDAACIG